MKTKQFSGAIVFLIAVLIMPLFLNAQLQHDKKYKFSINIPKDWSKKSYKDGTDKVFEYYSADQNAAVQIRAFEADNRITTDMLVQVYEQSMLPKGYSREAFNDHVSEHGIPGKLGVYQVNYDGTDVILVVFYTIQNSIGYVLTAIVPNVVYNQKEEEVKAVTRSFQIDGIHANVNSLPKNVPSTGGLGGAMGSQAKNHKPSSETNSGKTDNSPVYKDYRTLVLQKYGVKFSIPSDFYVASFSNENNVWSNAQRSVKFVIQFIPGDDGTTLNDLNESFIQQTTGKNNASVSQDHKVLLDGMTAYLMTMNIGNNLLNYVLLEAPHGLLALGYVSPVTDKAESDKKFDVLSQTLRKLPEGGYSVNPTVNSVVGEYKLVGRTDEKHYLKSWTLNLSPDQHFTEEILYKSGSVLKSSGSWKVSGDLLILTKHYEKASDETESYHILGNAIYRRENSAIYTFMK